MTTHHEALTLLPEAAWRKSSYSNDSGGNCVEIAALTSAHVAVRDSKVPAGLALLLSATAFAAVTESMKKADR